MTQVSELDTMKEIDESLSKIEDPEVRSRILNWIWAKFSPDPPPSHVDEHNKSNTNKGQATKPRKAKRSKKPKGKNTLTIIRDLNLRPQGSTSFPDFVAQKKPSNMLERCVVSVYYLIHTLNQGTVTSDHIYTCFKFVKEWRLPADLDTTLSEAASRHGWIDSSNRENIKLTVIGENLVEHDLPKTNKQ